MNKYKSIVMNEGGPCSSSRMSNADAAEIRALARAMRSQGLLPASVRPDTDPPGSLCDMMYEATSAATPMTRSRFWKLVPALLLLLMPGTARAAAATTRPNATLVSMGGPVTALRAGPNLLNVGTVAPTTRKGALPLVNAFKAATKNKLCATSSTCVANYAKMHALAARHVDDVQRSNPTLSAAADPHGIAPGTEVWVDNAFKVSFARHHGVYIGNGLVVDVGSIPESCRSSKPVMAKRMATMAFKAQGVGVTTLNTFTSRGRSWGVAQYPAKVTLPAQQALDNALKAMGPKPYSILADNCQHTASAIVTGVRRSDQVAAVLRTVKYLVLGGAAATALVRRRKKRT